MKHLPSPEVTSEARETYRTQLLAAPQRFALIRRAVGAQLRLWGYGDLVADAALCVTELLSNVHRHAGSDECELTLEALPGSSGGHGAGGGLRIAVADRSPVMPRPEAEPDWCAERGRGMYLISRTADAWGASLRPAGGKVVWAVLGAARRPRGTAGPVAERVGP
ncbi:ATP-binding protein [Streptomyces lycii]|uniref:ATP-binding protein n=1 Tax=Streptomyces lycii TaxID=2654337 RepID=A0ABQ7FE64_9ACTN|nr:ATP-binding protein [Streptomyces lycii]KAF4407115.1 ATP-binding protein [Streptomyces lycii]